MNHLSDEKIYHLAELVTQELLFTEDDIADMGHIGECDACYEALQCAIALMEAVDNADLVVMDAPVPEVRAKEKATAVIKVVILDVLAVMEQLPPQDSAWVFDKPLALAGVRSADSDTVPVQKLEDIDNSQTFVAYDPTGRKLIIQADDSHGAEATKACLKFSDGTKQEIAFQKREHLLWAEIHDLKEGEYEIILER